MATELYKGQIVQIDGRIIWRKFVYVTHHYIYKRKRYPKRGFCYIGGKRVRLNLKPGVYGTWMEVRDI